MGTNRCGVNLFYSMVLFIFIITGCSPVISQQSLKEVDKTLGFEWVIKNPGAYKGRTVLVGGSIIETRNAPGKTLITVLQRSLGGKYKPVAEITTKGRFILSVQGFLDPAIYRSGRKITAVGAVAGVEIVPLGDTNYTYPVIEEKELYLWPEKEWDSETHLGIGIGVGF